MGSSKSRNRKSTPAVRNRRRKLIGFFLIVLWIVCMIQILSGSFVMKDGESPVLPAAILTVLCGGGGLFLILYRERKK